VCSSDLFADLIEQCGGFSKTAGKVVSGGPMMGMQVTVN